MGHSFQEAVIGSRDMKSNSLAGSRMDLEDSSRHFGYMLPIPLDCVFGSRLHVLLGPKCRHRSPVGFDGHSFAPPPTAFKHVGNSVSPR